MHALFCKLTFSSQHTNQNIIHFWGPEPRTAPGCSFIVTREVGVKFDKLFEDTTFGILTTTTGFTIGWLEDPTETCWRNCCWRIGMGFNWFTDFKTGDAITFPMDCWCTAPGCDTTDTEPTRGVTAETWLPCATICPTGADIGGCETTCATWATLAMCGRERTGVDTIGFKPDATPWWVPLFTWEPLKKKKIIRSH